MNKLIVILCIYCLFSCAEQKKSIEPENLRTIIKCAIDALTSDKWFLTDYYDYLNYFTLVPYKYHTPPDSLNSLITYKYYGTMKVVALDTNNIKCLHDIFPRKTSLQFVDMNVIDKIRWQKVPVDKISFWAIGEFRQLNDIYYIEVGYSMTGKSGEFGKFLIQLDSSNTCRILDIQLSVS